MARSERAYRPHELRRGNPIVRFGLAAAAVIGFGLLLDTCGVLTDVDIIHTPLDDAQGVPDPQ